ncbi:D-alanine--D-alanine ligase family protein [Nocardioides sp. Kera G14]|uniref:D-alanine--D-alanine ligase family protein n=1 Tax=Nocardioides sp. Kera G14 TaxID=2884264 RepID=UPI002AB2CDCD|nr:D-alanine--D-alanine ligase family protein [Nocardioides sp. Kera G14]
MTPKIRVALLFGGRSGEHPVSIVTAAGVMGAMDPERYDVVPIGITRTGQWVVGTDNLAAAALTGGTLPEVTSASGAEVVFAGSGGASSLQVLEPGQVPVELGSVDVVFPVLHGPFGEDGTIQGLLELADVPYVGAGVLASAVGMDKEFMKLVFAGRGLPVGPFLTVRPREWAESRADVLAAARELSLPLFVKPARAGSSLGVTRVDSYDDLESAVEEAQRHDPKVLIEQGLEGREIECAVLGGRGGSAPRASVPGEIVVDHDQADFYDFEAKYVSATEARTEAPANLPAEVASRVQEVAVAAFEAIGAEGLSRVDVFVTEEGDVTINEINTMPGFTPISMYPKMWEASGLSYAELIDELIALALERPRGLR